MLLVEIEGSATRCLPTLKDAPPNRSATVASSPSAWSSATMPSVTTAISGAQVPVAGGAWDVGTEPGPVGPQATDSPIAITPATPGRFICQCASLERIDCCEPPGAPATSRDGA